MVKAQANLLCIGKDWFPNISGGLNRYVYELTHKLVSASVEIELCGTDLPKSDDSQLKLTNLANSDELICIFRCMLFHSYLTFLKMCLLLFRFMGHGHRKANEKELVASVFLQRNG